MPVPICLEKLERHGAAGVVSALKPPDYWVLVLPTYDASSNTIERSATDCAGRAAFDSLELAQAEGARSGPLVVKPDDAIVQPGPDNLRIVWLRTHRFADGTAAGPLALARPREGYAEVYATGFYRGREKNSSFAVERMGTHFAVTAGEEGCANVKPRQSCESSYQVLLMSGGKLVPSARFALERIDYRSMPGIDDPVQYRLTANPSFRAEALSVFEKLVVSDANKNVIRKSELQRVFRLEAGGHLVGKRQSLWEQLASEPRAPSPTEPRPAPQPSPKTTPR